MNRTDRPFPRRWQVKATPLWLAALIGALLLAGGRVVGLLANSLLVCGPAAVLAMLLGGPIAVSIARTGSRWRGVVVGVLAALALAPLHVVVAGWLSAVGDLGWGPALLAGEGPARGWVSGWAGAAWLHAVAATPLAALLCVAALASVDRRREEQALLEASRVAVFCRVTLPEAAPAIAAAAVLIAAWAATEIAVTDLLRVRTFAEEVYTQAAAGTLLGVESGAGGLAGRLAAGVVALAVAAGWALRVLVARIDRARDAPGRTARGVFFARPPWLLRLVVAGLTAILVAVPVGSMVLTAGIVVEGRPGEPVRVWRPAKAAAAVAAAPWQQRRELAASLMLGLAAATAATTLAAALSWGVRRRPLAGWVVAGGLVLAAATPGPVVGFAVIRLLNQPLESPFWWAGELYGTWFAPLLAQLVRVTPIAALVVWPALRAMPEEVVEAARVDGAGRVGRLGWIALPLVWPGLAAAWLAAFAFSVGELPATLLTAPPGWSPLSVRLLSLLHYGVEDRVAAICLVLTAGYAVTAFAVVRLLHAVGIRR